MNRPLSRLARRRLAGLAALMVMGMAGFAQAQLAVELNLERKTYVSYEPMVAEVTVYNRSGRDVVLGGLGNSSWLQFIIKDHAGNLLTPAGRRIAEEPVLVPAGQRVVRSIDLTNFYPVYDFGTYRVSASAYLPPLQRFYESEETKINVADGKIIWEDVTGTPAAQQGPASRRRFSLLTYRDTEKTELYVRLRDEDTGGVYATYSLGPVILFHRPQAAIAGDGRLHVLFLGAPQVFAHSIIGFDGQLVRRDVYRADGMTRPELTMAGGGLIQVRGGRMEGGDDPSSGTAAAGQTHRLSDRPAIPGVGR